MGLKEQLIRGLLLTHARGMEGYGLRGELVAAEAGVTLQQPEVRHVFSRGSCPWITLSFVAPKLPPQHPRLRPQRGFLVCGSFSSFTAPSLRCRSHPYSFVSVFSFFFCPTQVRGEFLAFWEVWGLLPAFSRCSVAVPHVDVFLMYLWGGRWSPCLTPPPSWRSPSEFLDLFPAEKQEKKLWLN